MTLEQSISCYFRIHQQWGILGRGPGDLRPLLPPPFPLSQGVDPLLTSTGIESVLYLILNLSKTTYVLFEDFKQ